MDFEDIYYHAVAIINGWEYCGNNIYKKTDDNVTRYEPLSKLDVVELESTTSELLLNEAFDFADYVFQSISELEPEDMCVNCGKATEQSQTKAYDGMCQTCFNAYHFPVW